MNNIQIVITVHPNINRGHGGGNNRANITRGALDNRLFIPLKEALRETQWPAKGIEVSVTLEFLREVDTIVSEDTPLVNVVCKMQANEDSKRARPDIENTLRLFMVYYL